MAFIVGEKKATRGGEFTLTLNNRSFKRNSTESVQIEVYADRLDDPIEKIVASEGVPRIGDVRNGRVCCKVTPQSVKMIPNPEGEPTYKWIVSAEYDSNFVADPLELPPEVSLSVEIVEESIWFDKNKKPIVNKNGERYPMTRPVCLSTWSITRYELPEFDPDAMNEAYALTINSSPFWGGRPAKVCYMLPITGRYVQVEIAEKKKQWFFHATYQFQYRSTRFYPDPWTRRVLHYGNTYRKKPGEPPRRCTDLPGRPTQVNLDIDGCKLADNAPPIFLAYEVEEETNFRDLGIDKDQIRWNS